MVQQKYCLLNSSRTETPCKTATTLLNVSCVHERPCSRPRSPSRPHPCLPSLLRAAPWKAWLLQVPTMYVTPSSSIAYLLHLVPWSHLLRSPLRRWCCLVPRFLLHQPLIVFPRPPLRTSPLHPPRTCEHSQHTNRNANKYYTTTLLSLHLLHNIFLCLPRTHRQEQWARLHH